MGIRMRQLERMMREMGLYSEQEFNRIHEYEKLRSDRNGMKFSHIVLSVNLGQSHRRTLKVGLSRLLRQLRITDHIGWDQNGRIGVILPGTDEVGARQFLNNTEKLLEGLFFFETKLISTYPLPEALRAAVSASNTIVETPESVEAEEVSIIPFKSAQ